MNASNKKITSLSLKGKNIKGTEKKLLRQFFMVFFMASLLVACSKDGNDGPVGPQGPQGEQGPAGPQGQDGEEGTANVIYSPWLASGFATPIANDFGSFTMDAPDLTQALIDTGVVLVYGKDDNNVVYALPATLQSTFSVESYWFTFTTPGSIEIVVQEVNGDDLNSIFIDNEFRYVLIPGGNPASGKSGTTLDYGKMTYKEIATLFNIPD